MSERMQTKMPGEPAMHVKTRRTPPAILDAGRRYRIPLWVKKAQAADLDRPARVLFIKLRSILWLRCMRSHVFRLANLKKHSSNTQIFSNFFVLEVVGQGDAVNAEE